MSDSKLDTGKKLPLIKFRTQVPIALSSQTKTYGYHEAIPMSEDDIFKLLVHGAEEIICVDGDKETPVTLENYKSLVSAGSADKDVDDTDDEEDQ